MRRYPLLVLSALVWMSATALHSRPAMAQMATPCSSCESCTAALARTDAHVEVSEDIVHEGDGPCIVIKGQGAQLDGLERDLRALGGKAPVGVRVEANGVLVKNLHIEGPDVGVVVDKAKEVTLFHNTIGAVAAGVQANGTDGLRITRSIIRKSKVGVSFGAAADGTCPRGAKMANPGAVVTGTHIEETQVGVAACDAMPVLKNNVIVRNATGVRLEAPAPGDGGDGAAGPFDPCVCKPDLPGAKSGTALFFSSGCHGCQVHEAWLPDLKAQGHDVLVRATGPENAQASAEFDALMDRCAPQVTDAIGIPGCVPNYVCLSNDVTFKVRKGENALDHETQLNSQAEVAKFEEACQAAAKRNYGASPGCVAHALHDNVVCANTKVDIAGAKGLERWAGIDNACAKVEGYADSDSQGCTKACPETLPDAVVPEARVREDAGAPAGALAPPPHVPPTPLPPAVTAPPPVPVPEPTAVPPPPAAEAAPAAAPPAEAAPDAATEAAGVSRQWLVIGGGLLALLLLVVVIWRKWDSGEGK